MTKLLLLLTLVYSILNADKLEEFPFVGLAVTTHSLDLPNTSNSDDPIKSTVGLRWGQQSVDWRTLFNLQYQDSGVSSFSMEIDRVLIEDTLLRPYIGGNLGMISYSNTDNIDSSESGFYWGITAGILMYASDNIDIDISLYHYNVEELDTLYHIQGASIAVHYFY
jgi:hypothetical protein